MPDKIVIIPAEELAAMSRREPQPIVVVEAMTDDWGEI